MAELRHAFLDGLPAKAGIGTFQKSIRLSGTPVMKGPAENVRGFCRFRSVCCHSLTGTDFLGDRISGRGCRADKLCAGQEGLSVAETFAIFRRGDSGLFFKHPAQVLRIFETEFSGHLCYTGSGSQCILGALNHILPNVVACRIAGRFF